MSDGKGFGEIALLNDNPRSATITCEEDTEFVTISKQAYKQVLLTLQEQQNSIVGNRLSCLEHFENIRKWFLMKAANFMKEKSFSRGQIIYRQGDPVSNVYIVVEGEFEVKVLLKKNQYNHLKDKYLTLSIVSKDKVLLFDDLIQTKICSHTLVCKSDIGVLNNIPA